MLNSLNSVCFPNTNTGYAVGDSGRILKTTNGGTDWTIQNSGTTEDLFSVCFTDVNNGYAAGESPILKTTNGGTTWTATSYGGLLFSITFPTQNIGYAAGFGTILKTTDAGTTWTNQNTGTDYLFESVFFTDPVNGYIVGHTFHDESGVNYKTTDGGITWIPQFPFSLRSLSSVFFSDANTGYIVGEYGTILKTTTGGEQGVVENYHQKKLLKLFPNPVERKLTVETPQLVKPSFIQLINVNGTILLRQQITEKKTSLDIGNLPAGVYFLKFQNGNSVEVKKLIKE